MEALSLTYNFVNPDEQGYLYIIGEMLVYITILSGLFGYAYNKKILFKKFWRYLIPLGICWDIYTIFWTGEFDTIEDMELYIIMGTMAVLILPIMVFQYLALYFYSYKSRNIWN